jgi:3-deoxy-7-phosphoheptulonate synthase
MKKYQGQAVVWKSVIGQYLNGNEALIGLMLESNLHEGNQPFDGDAETLKYGVSITDECICWETTEQLLLWAHANLQQMDPEKFQLAS